MSHVTVKQALEKAAAGPMLVAPIDAPVSELVARTLYDISNIVPDNRKATLARANRARRIIFDRISGRRRAGTAPAVKQSTAITFVDLTVKQLEAPNE